jgi:aryl-alcohol dehydrogenase-like predicted oxidoreductase
MEKRKLGSQGLIASQLGLGCMGMSEFYGVQNDEESIKTLHQSLELGINFWDTADAYGPYKNEELVGTALKGKRQQVTLATKFGIVRSLENPAARSINGKPD